MSRANIPPHDADTERLVLGAYMLRGPDVKDEIEAVLADTDFYRESHSLVFAALRALRARGAPTHTQQLLNELEKTDKVGAAGGTDNLLALTDGVPLARDVEKLCKALADLAAARRMQEAAGAVYGGGFGIGAHDAHTYIDEAGARIQAAAETRKAVETSAKLGDVSGTVLYRAYEAFNRGLKLTGVASGFQQLDRMTTGFHGGELIIIGGRPGMGKSGLAQAMALNIGAQGEPVLLVSLEMQKSQWAERALASCAHVDLERIRTASFLLGDARALGVAQDHISALPIEVDDGNLSVIDVRIRARRMKRKHGKLGAVIVDYLQLMRPTLGSAKQNREQQVSEISRGLKQLAKELDCPVVALAQVSRDGEKSKADKRPLLSDLRESGAIEQDADVVMFVYRDEYYDKDTIDQGIAEIIIRKQRNGPLGTAKVRYFGQYVRFQDLQHEAPQHGY